MAVSVDTIFLDPGHAGTLQQQIRRAVIAAVLAGRYGPGDRMPSSRKLAKHLGISRITVTLAYTELVSGDYLTARGRSGYFVSDTAPRAPEFDTPERSGAEDVDWQRSIGQRFSERAALVRPQAWREFRYPFIYGQADATLFDHQNWRLCALQG